MAGGIAVLLLIALVIGIRFGLGALDRDRIAHYVESKGGRIIDARWTPFGPGWFGDRSRIYEVRYVDSDGNQHEAYSKTSFWTGVYFTEDRAVTHRAEPAETRVASLEEENRRLREDVERLRRGKPDAGANP